MSSRPAADGVTAVQTVTHRETWRGVPYSLNYVLLEDEPSAANLLASYHWALREGLTNPRVISPHVLAWSSLFQPTLHAAIASRSEVGGSFRMRFVGGAPRDCNDAAGLRTFWLQSTIFLAAVTLSAAIVQGRWSRGTIESKFDRLWQAAASAALPTTTDRAGLRAEIVRLSSAPMPSIELLLAIRRLFMDLVKTLSNGISAERVIASVAPMVEEARFGFAAWLAHWLPGLTGVIVYGSSVSGTDYADIDAVLVVEDAELALRMLENRKLEWGGKELNVGVYTEGELWRMQLLSGDNLADYGLCILGEVPLPHKPVPALLARNLSFGIVRQRQQHGMLSRALADEAPVNDDRRNLHHYFVKIPANVVKGTFGATGRLRTKRDVNEWLRLRTGFDTDLEQQKVVTDGPVAPLASSALATMNALRELNVELGIIEPQLEEVA